MFFLSFLLAKNEPGTGSNVAMHGGDLMSKKHQSKWNVEDLSDPDIYEAIRYLEPDLICGKQQKEATAFACHEEPYISQTHLPL